MTEHVPTPHLTDPTVLVTLTGADQSGVSTRLFEALAGFEIEVIDVEQLIVRGRLVLSALVTVPSDSETFEQTMSTVGEEFGARGRARAGRRRQPAATRRTRTGDTARPSARVRPRWPPSRQGITDAGGNIDRILRLARYPVTALRMEVSGADPDVLQSDLAAAAYRPRRRHRGRGTRDPAACPATRRHGRRLHAHPGRGHRDAGRARRMRHRGRADHRRGHARRARLRGVAAGSGGTAGGARCLGDRRRAGVDSSTPPGPAPWCGRSSGWATGSRW